MLTATPKKRVQLYELTIERTDRQYGTDQSTWYGIVAAEDIILVKPKKLGWKDGNMYSYRIGSLKALCEVSTYSLSDEVERFLAEDHVAVVIGCWRFA